MKKKIILYYEPNIQSIIRIKIFSFTYEKKVFSAFQWQIFRRVRRIEQTNRIINGRKL